MYTLDIRVPYAVCNAQYFHLFLLICNTHCTIHSLYCILFNICLHTFNTHCTIHSLYCTVFNHCLNICSTHVPIHSLYCTLLTDLQYKLYPKQSILITAEYLTFAYWSAVHTVPYTVCSEKYVSFDFWSAVHTVPTQSVLQSIQPLLTDMQ